MRAHTLIFDKFLFFEYFKELSIILVYHKLAPQLRVEKILFISMI